MPFSDAIKLRVRRKAAFRCCRCQQMDIDVHHIIPESDGGPNKIDNAAPLCKNCHDLIGQNPEKQKMIRQMRDWWYDRCEEIYSGRPEEEIETLKTISSQLEEIKKGHTAGITELKTKLHSITDGMINTVSPVTATQVASAVVNATDAASSNTVNTYETFGLPVYYCRQCNVKFSSLASCDKCPICGTAL